MKFFQIYTRTFIWVALLCGALAYSNPSVIYFDYGLNKHFGYSSIPVAIKNLNISSAAAPSNKQTGISSWLQWIPFFVTKQFIKDELNGPKKELAMLATQFNALEKSTAQLPKELQNLEHAMKKCDDQLLQTKNEVAHNFDVIANQLGYCDIQRASIANDINNVETKLEMLQTRNNQMQNSLNVHTQEIKKHQNLLLENVSTINQEQQNLLDTIGNQYQTAHEQLCNAMALVKTNKENIATLKTALQDSLDLAQSKCADQKKISEQLHALKQFVQVQTKKISALANTCKRKNGDAKKFNNLFEKINHDHVTAFRQKKFKL